jgi:hypothetical protein
MLGVDSDDGASASAATGAAAAHVNEIVWRVDSMTSECMAGLEILQYSTPIEERRGLERSVAGARVPVLGVVDTNVVMAGETYYIPGILVVAGIYGGVWSPKWAGAQGFRTRLGFGPASAASSAPSSWLETPSHHRIELDSDSQSFTTTVTRP